MTVLKFFLKTIPEEINKKITWIPEEILLFYKILRKSVLILVSYFFKRTKLIFLKWNKKKWFVFTLFLSYANKKFTCIEDWKFYQSVNQCLVDGFLYFVQQLKSLLSIMCNSYANHNNGFGQFSFFFFLYIRYPMRFTCNL